jgi:lipopolysaccharide cholinephosphotransferase
MKKILNKIQKKELSMLLHLISILDKHKISFFLIYGSLLGSIRHGGFIPWDDDIDIGLTAEAEIQFLKIPKTEFLPYFLVDWNTDKGFGLPFYKLVLNKNITVGTKNYEAWIDIFVFNNLSNSRVLSNLQFFFSKIIRLLILIKSKYRIKFKYYLFLGTFFVLLLLTKKELIKIYNFNSRLFSKNQKYVINFAGTYSFSREHFDKKNIESLTQIKFENIPVMIPALYHNLLTKFYGNYLLLPPKKDRRNRHLK